MFDRPIDGIGHNVTCRWQIHIMKPDHHATRNLYQLPRIGPAGRMSDRHLTPRMVRYLEEQGVIAAERGPGPRGHRHYPPPESASRPGRRPGHGCGASNGDAAPCPPASLADQRVRDARLSDNSLAWFQLLALGRAVEIRSTDRRTGTEAAASACLFERPSRAAVTSLPLRSPGRSARMRTSGHCWSSTCAPSVARRSAPS